MLVDGCDALHHEFVQHLRSQKEGAQGMMRWAASRANGRWHQTIVQMIQKLVGHETIDRLKLTMPSPNHVFEFDPANELLRDESVLLGEYGKLVFSLACNRAWSQAHFGLVFPYCLVRIMSPDELVRTRARTFLRKLAEGILKLEDMEKNASKQSSLHKLLEDVGTNTWVVTREAFIEGIRCDWDPQSPVLRKMAFSMNAGPSTTKYCLENVINTVKDCSLRSTRNNMRMSVFSKWLYAATSKHANDGGVEQLKVSTDDLVELTRLQTDDEFYKNRVWTKGKETFHQIVPKPEQILAEIRKAGYLANKQSAAAAAFILMDAQRNFANVNKAWAGKGFLNQFSQN